MDQIRLTKPGPEHESQVWAMRRELMEARDPDNFAGCAGLEECESYGAWLERLRLGENPATVPEGRVPASVYLALRESDRRIVGIIDLRHHIDHPILGTWGGHIGYIIRPSERGKGYAPRMLRLCVEKARERGIPRVLVTCHTWNTKSERTILRCGGVLENEIAVDGGAIRRYWINTESASL